MVSLNEVFELLSKERRRYALYYLEQQEGPVSVEELAAQVAEWETDHVSDCISEGKYERIKVDLFHSDLPKAAKIEYIEYDPIDGVVEVIGSPPEFEAILTIARVIESPERDP